MGKDCPNCQQRGVFDLMQRQFEEWRCNNRNCRVGVYHVYHDG